LRPERSLRYKTLKPCHLLRLVMKGKVIYQTFKTTNGRTIILRPLLNSDLEAMVPFANSFVNERRRNPYLGITSLDHRMTKTDEKEFLDKILKDTASGRRISVAAFDGNLLVGHCDIAGRTSKDERHTGLLGIIVMDGYRGLGLGQKMMMVALGRASKLGIWVVELEVFANNKPARHLYEKLGFVKAGVIPKKVHRNGRYVDIVQMYTHLTDRKGSTS